jgi:hypothetical protein
LHESDLGHLISLAICAENGCISTIGFERGYASRDPYNSCCDQAEKANMCSHIVKAIATPQLFPQQILHPGFMLPVTVVGIKSRIDENPQTLRLSTRYAKPDAAAHR